MIEAVNDGHLWELHFTTVPPPSGMAGEIARRLMLARRGSMLPFTVIDRTTGRTCGMTTFMNGDAANKRVEIGSTWYRRSAQRTHVNTEAKLLLR